jgi:hypothetical protein
MSEHEWGKGLLFHPALVVATRPYAGENGRNLPRDARACFAIDVTHFLENAGQAVEACRIIEVSHDRQYTMRAQERRGPHGALNKRLA